MPRLPALSLRTPFLALALAALSASSGCFASKADRAAKARIFSPEGPAPDLRHARERLDLDRASSDGRIWGRLWQMDRVEIADRAGAHKAHAKTRFTWTRGTKTIDLTEDVDFAMDDHDQFHATITNSQDRGLEFIWVGGHAYAKGLYGAFHVRRNDRAQQNYWRDQAIGVLASVYGLLDRRLHGTPVGPTTIDGRAAERFSLTAGAPWGPKPPATTAPPPVYGKVRLAGEQEDIDGGTRNESKFAPGPDEETARRLAFDARKEVESISGDIAVDQDAGVILRANVNARLRVSGKGSGDDAVLNLTVEYTMDPQPGLRIEAPSDVSILKLPHAVKDPLWFWDADAGTR